MKAAVEVIFKKDQLNGAILITAPDGKQLMEANGSRNGDSPVSINTQFQLADASAIFTGLLIKKLIDAGSINLTDRVNSFLPELPYQELTVEHLLRHTSGLPDYFLLEERFWNQPRPFNNYDLLDILVKHEPRLFFYPGEFFRFSHTNYALLALVAERVMTLEFGEALKQIVFAPFGMPNSGLTSFSSQQPIGPFATDISGKISSGPETSDVNGDFSGYTTLSDMAAWSRHMQKNQEISSILATLPTEKEVPYHFGWVIDPVKMILYHDGNWGGHKATVVCHYPTAWIIVIFSNRGDNLVKIERKLSKIIQKH
ncbi:MAG: serine hydrolase domain-containing protein [Bacteroidota bacterium]